MVQQIVSVSVKGLEDISAMFLALRKEDMPKALAESQNTVAYKGMLHIRSKIPTWIDSPKPITKRSPRYTKTTITKQPPANIRIMDSSDIEGGAGAGGLPPVAYLSPLTYGGERADKSFERFLRGRGLLPDGEQCAPGYDARMDAYGNQSGGQIKQIMQALKGTPTISGDRLIFKWKGKYYIVRKHVGIMMVQDGTMFSLMHFISRPRYRKQFDFYDTGLTFIEDNYEDVVNEILKRKLAKYGGR